MRDQPSYCVVVADSARARFFKLEHAEDPEMEGGPDLRELTDLVNPEAQVPPRQMFANRRGAERPSFRGGQSQRYDDHRSDHIDELERRFVRELTSRIESLIASEEPNHLVLVAPPQALGFIRPELKVNGCQLHVLEANLATKGRTEIHSYLSRADILPERRTPAHVTARL